MNDIADRLTLWREHPAVMVRELFGVEPDLWQVDVLEAFPHQPRIAMKACAGPGKAQPNDLVIDTPFGPRQWGSLACGDFVFAPDGAPTMIRAVYARGDLPMYRVVFDDGTATVACGEHLWKVRGRTERRHFNARQRADWNVDRERWARAQGYPITPADGYVVISTEEIIARNKSNDGKRRQFEIPRHQAVQYPHAVLPLDPYVLGVWLGDGGRRTGRGSWRDPEIDREIIRRGYNLTRTDAGRAVTVHGLAGQLRNLELFDLYSYQKFVPDRYKYVSIEQRTAILSGLMDTDGSIASDGSMSFDVTSGRLVDDVAWLVRSLGGVAIKRSSKQPFYRDKNGAKIMGRTCYRVTVTLDFDPFHVMKKKARWKHPQERYLTRYIDRIEALGSAEASCIEVDHSTSCYLTNDFIVTHNTACLAWLAWNFMLTRPHPRVGCTSINSDNLKSNLWAELALWRSNSPLLERLFEMTKGEIYARESPETWKMEARTWARDANAVQIGNALRGLHSKYVMWLLDETGDYPSAVLPTCENIFAGSPAEAHIVQAGNPTKLDGPLYHAHINRDLWAVTEITADPDDPKRTPRVSIEHARNQIRTYGRDNPWIVVNVFGQFPPQSINALIGPDEVRNAMKRYWRPHEIGTTAPKILGVDVARYGDDSSIIFPRQGIQAFPFQQFRNLNSTQGASQVAAKWDAWDADAAFIDNGGGYGSGWIDNLARIGKAPIGVDFGGSARNNTQYSNKRAEMAFDAVAWIKAGGALPESEALLQALTLTTYTFDKQGSGSRMILEPKDEVKKKMGGRSPDEFDGFILTFAEPVSAKQARIGVSTRNAASEYKPFAELDREVSRSYAASDAGYDPFKV